MSDRHVMHVLRALQDFFGGFLPAYAEGCAPDGAEPPYITYRLVVPDALGEAAFYARLWYRGRGYQEIAAMADAIGAAIGPGCALPTEGGGTVWIYREERFAQFLPLDGDARLKCCYLSMKLIAVTE